MYRSPEVFINAFSQSLPVLLLSTFFGPVAAGFYTISKRVVKMPSHLIGNSIADVFYPRIAEDFNNNKNITKLLTKATLLLAIVGLIPFGIIILFGPSLFSFIFGNDWTTAGLYARWIGIGSYFTFINKPSIKTLPVIGAQKFHLIHSTLSVFFKSIGLIIGGYMFNSEIMAIALYSILGAILDIALVLVAISKSKQCIIKKYNLNSTSTNCKKHF